jgi:hypothetical protein
MENVFLTNQRIYLMEFLITFQQLSFLPTNLYKTIDYSKTIKYEGKYEPIRPISVKTT